jgi:hypothetical protein
MSPQPRHSTTADVTHEEVQVAKDAKTIPLRRVLDNAEQVTGHRRHTVAGAMAGVSLDEQVTPAAVKDRVRKWLRAEEQKGQEG